MKTELEIKMETCPHDLVKMDIQNESGFTSEGWFCQLCGCTIQGDKITPATSWSINPKQ